MAPRSGRGEEVGGVDRDGAAQRQDREKLDSVHAPEGECLAKGKAQKRSECGCKVSVASTSRGNWMVGARPSSR